MNREEIRGKGKGERGKRTKKKKKSIKEASEKDGGGERGSSATQRDRERLSRSLNKQQRQGPKGIGCSAEQQ